ncbi:MAG TPA: hypothetical protein VF194_19520 [Ferrovibrio sp.]|uniref:hypothetical protein n=1 Tax=Ferrovibrio sp. TaxID=1917215 RepID=UPI002ED5E87A
MANQLAKVQPAAPPIPPGRVPAPAPAPSELERHLVALDAWHAGAPLAAMVPREAIPALRTELERRAQPATSRYQLAVLASMLAAFPQRQPDHADAYLGSLIEEAAGFSDEVLYLAAKEVRRTLRFLPTVAEFLEIAEKHAQAADLRKRKLERMERLYNDLEIAERLQQLYRGAIDFDDARYAASELGRRAASREIGQGDVQTWWRALLDGNDDALEVCRLARQPWCPDVPRLIELVAKIAGS